MTSKNLFFNLCKEDLKRRLWSLVVIIMLFLVFGPIKYVLRLQYFIHQINDGYSIKSDVINWTIEFMSTTNGYFFVITIILAICLAIHGFYFVFSKKQIDFYHSMPIKREKLFLVSYLNGLLIYIIPYLISMLICVLISYVNGFGDIRIWGTLIVTIFSELSGFLLIYSVSILAVMLTGNFIVATLGSIVLLGYGYVVQYIIMACEQVFYKTVVGGFLTGIPQTCWFSPLVAVYKVHMTNGDNYTGIAQFVDSLIYLMIPALIFSILALYLYKRRPSEASGRAMTFDVTKRPIEVLICIPCAMICGLFLKGMSYNQGDGWLYFGTIVGGIIIYLVIEVIYDFDIRAIMKITPGPIITAALAVFIITLFKLDVMGFDKYIPDASQINYAAVEINGLNSEIEYVSDEIGVNSYISKADYTLKYMKVKNVEPIIQIAESGINNLNIIDDLPMNSSYVNITIYYTLKNGKVIPRTYFISRDDNFEILNELYSDNNYKEGSFLVYNMNSDNIKKISWNDQYGYAKEVNYTESQREELIDIYKEELYKLSLNEITEEFPIGSLDVTYLDGEGDKYDSKLYLYPSFVRTLEYLNSLGMDTSNPYKIEEVKSIEINIYKNTDDAVDKYNMSYKEAKDKNMVENQEYIIYNQPEKITEILPLLIENTFSYSNGSFITSCDDCSVTVNYKNGYSQEYRFKKDIPEFILNDIKAE